MANVLKKIELTADNSNMNQELSTAHDRQDNQAIDSETVLHAEPELLLPIDEYATRHGISRRTVNRYVKSGRLDSSKNHGRTMIVDKPLKPQSQDSRHVKPNIDSQLVPFAQADWIRFGILQARSKSKTIWQTYAIVVTILLFALTLVSVCLFMQLRFLTS